MRQPKWKVTMSIHKRSVSGRKSTYSALDSCFERARLQNLVRASPDDAMLKGNDFHRAATAAKLSQALAHGRNHHESSLILLLVILSGSVLLRAQNFQPW